MARAVFRVDASDRIGSGHVSRCLVLAEALREAGTRCSFVCADVPGHLGALIGERGFEVRLIPDEDWPADAEATEEALSGGDRPEWLVVDHYRLDTRWENRLLGAVEHICAIDDLADRPHAATLLLDQNLVGGREARYSSLLPAGARMLLGPDYALLQPEYAARRREAMPRTGPVRRVLVHFGATDPGGLCLSALRALQLCADPGLEVDVAPPRDAVQQQALREMAAGTARVRVHGWLPSLAGLVAAADLGIGACGVSTWERLCLGLPTLVVTVADNQREIANELARRGLVRLLGHVGEVAVEDIARELGRVLEEGLAPAWSQACMATVDGLGAARVVAAMTLQRDAELRARPARPADEARLLEWANDPVTRANAFNPARIDEGTHHRWFGARLGEPEACHFYILEAPNGAEVGSVRFQREEEAWEIHFSLAPPYRGRGLGTRLVAAAIRRLRADTIPDVEIFGRVKAGNAASCRIFEALGFVAEPAAPGAAITFRQQRGVQGLT